MRFFAKNPTDNDRSGNLVCLRARLNMNTFADYPPRNLLVFSLPVSLSTRRLPILTPSTSTCKLTQVSSEP